MALTILREGPHPDALVQDASLSDLFFNYDLANLRAFDADTPPDDEEPDFDPGGIKRREALLKDAMIFAATLQNATGVRLEPSELVRDYLDRE